MGLGLPCLGPSEQLADALAAFKMVGCAGDFPPTPLPGGAPHPTLPARPASRAFSGAPRFGEKGGREGDKALLEHLHHVRS